MNKEETIILRVENYQKNWVRKLVKDKTYESESDYVRTLIDNDIQANSK
jgi:Arc/MetJ-type ribon-helix-helix transcriptional regulator